MVAHPDRAAQGPGQCIQVDEGFESLVFGVEATVVNYLVRADDASRAALLDSVASLDEGVEASEQYQRRLNSFTSLTGIAGLGRSSLDVVGQRSDFPAVSEVPVVVFRAQIALVRAAKDELRAPTPATLDALDVANDELAAARNRSATCA